MARDLAEVVDFGRYEPLFRIGLGGMAEVYAARIRGEAGFQKLVAVKRMLPHLTGDKKFVDMFLDEARLAANISSPHVVQTLDLGRADDDSLYIVMDLILGVTISQMLRHHSEKKQFVDPGIAIELISQAAQGLDDAHEAVAPNGQPLSIVHRDISPQNILIGTDGRSRVTDFGIAHAMLLRRTETQVGEMKGKFAYFSPEQALGKPLDRRSDIFALGIVSWELLTGRRLFRGTPLEQLESVKRAEIPKAIDVRSDLPEALSTAVMQALARDADDRFASAAAFSASLRRAATSLDEIPGPRVIGRLVKEVGGDRLERMRQCIANSGKLPADVPKVTAIIEGTVSGTHFIAENAEATHILEEDEVSEIVQSSDVGRAADKKETARHGIPATEHALMAFGSGVTTNELPNDHAIADLPTRPPQVVPPTVIRAPSEMSLTIPDEHADIHQAPTQQWMDSAQSTTWTGAKSNKPLLLGIGVSVAALLLVVLGAVVASTAEDEAPEAAPATTVAAPPLADVEDEPAELEPTPNTEQVAEATATNGAAEEAPEPAEAANAELQVEPEPAGAEADDSAAAARRQRLAQRRRERERRERERRERQRRAEEQARRNMGMAAMGMSGIPDF